MSDTKYWRIRMFVEKEIEEESFPMHYSKLISGLDGSEKDNFYLGMVVQDLVAHGKLSWDSKRNLISASKPIEEEPT